MSYIFLDESGDLGFNQNKTNSKFFIITAIFTSDRKSIKKIVKKIHAGLRKKIKAFGGGVLHSVKEKRVTRIRLLKNLTNEKHILYNYITNILIDRIFTKNLVDKNSHIVLVASKRETNKFLNLNFENYLKHIIKNKHKLDINVQIKTPSEEKALQAVDFISWSIFRKYEFKDLEYYKIVKNQIVEENRLFK